MSTPDYLISTPENVDLHLELAGIGNRVLAAVIDTAITYTVLLVMIVLCVFIGHGLEKLSLTQTVRAVLSVALLSLAILVAFAVTFGYHIYFEGVWRGQTPGKKAAGIRVVEQNGQPVGWSAVIIRNLIRVVDTGLALVGLVVILIDRNERRIGDLAAGTLVIRERGRPFGGDAKLPVTTAVLPDKTFVDVGRLSPAEYELLLSFLERRNKMSKSQRPLLAKKLDSYFRAKLEETVNGEPPERFLETIYAAYNARAD